MYYNVGGKLKVVSKIFFWIGCIASVIAGISFLNIEMFEVAGILFIVAGPLLSLVGSWAMYALGDIAEGMEYMIYMKKMEANDTRSGNGTLQFSQNSNGWICDKCNTKNDPLSQYCKNCGKYR